MTSVKRADVGAIVNDLMILGEIVSALGRDCLEGGTTNLPATWTRWIGEEVCRLSHDLSDELGDIPA